MRGKTPWHVRRNYEPKRMNEIPYRRPEGDPRADEIASLVRQIAANRRALLPYRPLVRDLGRIVKDPWKDGPVVLDRPALVASQVERLVCDLYDVPADLADAVVDHAVKRARAGMPDDGVASSSG